MSPDILSVLLSLVTAVAWALVIQLQKRGLANIDGRTGALVVVLSFAVFFWILAPFLVEWHWFSSNATLIFVVSGLLVPGMAQQFHMLSVEKLGPTLSSVVGAFAPVFAVIPAALFLDEVMNSQAMVGIALMVMSVVFSVQAKTKSTGTFSLIFIWFAIAAACTRGLGQPVSKYGLNELPEPFFATLVMVTAAAVFVGASHRLRDRNTIRFQFDRNCLWLCAAGSILGAGFLSLYAALNVGDVVIVAPFIATTPIWVVLLDHFIFKHDKIGRRHLLSAVLVTVGAVLLVSR